MPGTVLDARERMKNTISMGLTFMKLTISANGMTVQKCKVLWVLDLGGGQERLS